MLSPQMLELLRLWWREGKRRVVMLPHGWWFPGRSRTDPISSRQLHRAVQEAAEVPASAKGQPAHLAAPAPKPAAAGLHTTRVPLGVFDLENLNSG